LPSSEEGAKALPAEERVERGLAASDEQREVAGTDRCRGDPEGTTCRLRRFANVR
jgi:hypothetical protein